MNKRGLALVVLLASACSGCELFQVIFTDFPPGGIPGGGPPPGGGPCVATQLPGGATLPRLHDLHNQDRALFALAALNPDPRLNAAAQKHAEWMAQRGKLSHVGQAGSSSTDRAQAEGYPGVAGENIAQGYASADAVFAGWLASTGHRNNIRNFDYDDVGYGLAQDSNGRLWWAVSFGIRQCD